MTGEVKLAVDKAKTLDAKQIENAARAKLKSLNETGGSSGSNPPQEGGKTDPPGQSLLGPTIDFVRVKDRGRAARGSRSWPQLTNRTMPEILDLEPTQVLERLDLSSRICRELHGVPVTIEVNDR